MTSASADPNLPPRPRAARGPFVMTMILIAGALFIATEFLLYYRWATMIEPTCVLIVDTSPPLKGATLEVDGVLLAQPHKIVVGEADRYTIPVYLEPGQYTLKIRQNDQLIFDQPVELSSAARGKKFDLTKLPPASTRPVATPATSNP